MENTDLGFTPYSGQDDEGTLLEQLHKARRTFQTERYSEYAEISIREASDAAIRLFQAWLRRTYPEIKDCELYHQLVLPYISYRILNSTSKKPLVFGKLTAKQSHRFHEIIAIEYEITDREFLPFFQAMNDAILARILEYFWLLEARACQ